MKQVRKKGGSKVAESVSVLLVSIAAVLTAIDQISIVLTIKKLWRQMLLITVMATGSML